MNPFRIVPQNEQTIPKPVKDEIVSNLVAQLRKNTLMYVGAHDFSYGVAMRNEREMVFVRFKASGKNYKKGLYIYIFYDLGTDEYIVEGIVTINYNSKIVGTYTGVQVSQLHDFIETITDGAVVAPVQIGEKVKRETSLSSGVKLLNLFDDYAGVSLAFRDTDLKGNPLLDWMKPIQAQERNNPKYLSAVKPALDSGEIEKAILKGLLMPKDAVTIIYVANLTVPTSIIAIAELEDKYVAKRAGKMTQYINSLGLPENEKKMSAGGLLSREAERTTDVFPNQISIYVPSTSSVNEKVFVAEFKNRISEVESFMSKTFGGFTEANAEGGYTDVSKALVKENVGVVKTFAKKADFEKNKDTLLNQIRAWSKSWGQEAIGVEYNGKLYYISEKTKKFDDGGAVDDIYTGEKVRKGYVSIRVKYETLKNPKDFSYSIKSFDEGVFKELSQLKLSGIEGISSSNYNISEWLVHRECMIVMPMDKLRKLNDLEQVKYFDADYLTKNGCDALFRLYDRNDRDDRSYYAVLQNLFPKIAMEFEWEAESKANKQAASNLYAVKDIYDVYRSGKFLDYISKQKRINSPLDMANLTMEYITSGQMKKDDYYLTTPEGMQANDLIAPITRGIVYAGQVYKEESEWLVKNKELVIPEGSQLFFMLKGYENMREQYEKYINKFDLRKHYTVNFIEQKRVDAFQMVRFNMQRERFDKDLAVTRSKVDEKMATVLNQIRIEMIQDFESKIRSEVQEYMGSEYYRNEESEELGPDIFEIPVFKAIFDSIIYKFNELYKTATENIIKNKNKYYLEDVMKHLNAYLENMEAEEGESDSGITNQYGKMIRKYDFIHPIVRTARDFDVYKYRDVIKERVGADLYKYFDKKTIMMNKGGSIYEGETMQGKKHNDSWFKQKEWKGNPALGYESYMKHFKNPFNGRYIPVFIFGKAGSGKNTPIYGTGRNPDGSRKIDSYYDAPDWSYVVSAGANSDYSYSGGFYPNTPTLEEAMKIVDEKYANKKLIYEDGGDILGVPQVIIKQDELLRKEGLELVKVDGKYYIIKPNSPLEIGDMIEWNGELIKYEGHDNIDSIWSAAVKAGRKVVATSKLAIRPISRNGMLNIISHVDAPLFKLYEIPSNDLPSSWRVLSLNKTENDTHIVYTNDIVKVRVQLYKDSSSEKIFVTLTTFKQLSHFYIDYCEFNSIYRANEIAIEMMIKYDDGEYNERITGYKDWLLASGKINSVESVAFNNGGHIRSYAEEFESAAPDYIVEGPVVIHKDPQVDAFKSDSWEKGGQLPNQKLQLIELEGAYYLLSDKKKKGDWCLDMMTDLKLNKLSPQVFVAQAGDEDDKDSKRIVASTLQFKGLPLLEVKMAPATAGKSETEAMKLLSKIASHMESEREAQDDLGRLPSKSELQQEIEAFLEKKEVDGDKTENNSLPVTLNETKEQKQENKVGSAIYFLRNEKHYVITDGTLLEKLRGLNWRVSKRGDDDLVVNLTDDQLVQLAIDNGFEKLQTTELENLIYAEMEKCKHLESKETVKCLHYALGQKNIPHYVFQGVVWLDKSVIPLHYWIGLPDGRIVDFKAQMWLGKNAQKGIFKPTDTKAIYSGGAIEMNVSKTIYDILTRTV